MLNPRFATTPFGSSPKECEEEMKAIQAEGDTESVTLRLYDFRQKKKEVEVVMAIASAAQKYGLSSKGFQEIVLQETHRMSLEPIVPITILP
eukprot:791006-Amphidinium_carterae.2